MATTATIARPWRAAFPDAADWHAPVMTGTIPALLDAAAGFGERPAIEFRDRRISYRELAAAADALAAGLLAEGIAAGEAVALYLPNTPLHPVAFFALARTGARIVHLSPLDAPRELAHKLRDSFARIAITTDLSLLQTALRLLDEGVLETLLVGEDSAWGPSVIAPVPVPWSGRVRRLPSAARPARWPDVAPSDVCLLQYTGGTTGVPKAAMLTHANLTAAVWMYNNWRDGPPLVPGEQRAIAVLPLFHIFALTTVMLRHLSQGNELLLRQRFDVATLLDDIGTKRATVFSGVPTMWTALANHPGADRCDFSSLRFCTSGGAPLPFDVEQRVERLIGTRLRPGWGMTETGPAGTRAPLAAEPVAGMIGIPLPGIDLHIVDRTNPARVLPPGEEGEIAVRGANVFAGYWNQPAETAAAFHEGYFLTGDIGVMDARGVFRILDRKKNMIISGGFNVYPVAIENAIYEHPSVAEALVIGIPDAYRGQAAKAFVALRHGAPTLTLENLRAFLADRLGRHELPAALEIRAELPKSPAGKLLAKVLRDEEAAKA